MDYEDSECDDAWDEDGGDLDGGSDVDEDEIDWEVDDLDDFDDDVDGDYDDPDGGTGASEEPCVDQALAKEADCPDAGLQSSDDVALECLLTHLRELRRLRLVLADPASRPKVVQLFKRWEALLHEFDAACFDALRHGAHRLSVFAFREEAAALNDDAVCCYLNGGCVSHGPARGVGRTGRAAGENLRQHKKQRARAKERKRNREECDASE
jgi:hypothetical protein